MDDNTNAVVPEVLDTESITKERETNIENEAESKTVTSMTMDNEIVQSNALVEGCYALTDVEQRVLFALISAIGNDKTAFDNDLRHSRLCRKQRDFLFFQRGSSGTFG